MLLGQHGSRERRCKRGSVLSSLPDDPSLPYPTGSRACQLGPELHFSAGAPAAPFQLSVGPSSLQAVLLGKHNEKKNVILKIIQALD